jgi:hypothetical protein
MDFATAWANGKAEKPAVRKKLEAKKKRLSCRKQGSFMLSYSPMLTRIAIAAGLVLLLAWPASAQDVPVSGTPPHIDRSKPQVVRTPQTVIQPDVVNEGNDGLAATISSPATPAAWARQTIAIAPCAVPPKIDGRLGDPCWKTATHASGFFRLGGAAGIADADQTEAWLTADSTHLYIAFHCLDSHPESIHANQIQRNGSIGEDDYVSVDIDSQNSHHGYSTFQVTARGTQGQYLEGGTADNITWAGDWKAAAVRTKDGWTAELSIPFALLRYSKGAKAFGIDLSRKLAREPSLENWPYLPPDGNNNESLYIHEFTGIHPPFLAPRPIFLPYTLLTGGSGNSGRFGLDIKYPLSTTITGVASLFPDFQTIEQDVTSINFSYTEKLLNDRRPFFAEGSSYLPYRDLFYSRRIGVLDGGLKIAGKQGDNAVGLLATDTRGAAAENAVVFALSHDLGLYSHAAVNFVSDIVPGQPSNQVAKFEGQYGWRVGHDSWSFTANHTPSWQGGRLQDSKDYWGFNTTALPGHPTYSVNHVDIGPGYVTNLGFEPDLNEKGTSANIEQYNQFDKGRLRLYDINISATSYQHHTGGFFQNDYNGGVYLESREGYSVNVNIDQSRRDDFHDHANQASFGWGKRTLYQRGSISDTVGRQGGELYNFFTLNQGVLVSRPFSLQLNFNRLRLGGSHSTQTILTGNYLLSGERSLGARIVNQAGADQGGGLGTNIYFSFGQHVRSGADLFLLFGDPNSPKTRGKVTLKVIRPF